MTVGPGYIYTGVSGDVDFYASWFAAGMERDGHGLWLRLTHATIERSAATGRREGFAVRAKLRRFEEVACGVHGEVTVSEFDAPAGIARDVHIVGNHDDGVTGLVEFAKNVDDNLFVGFIEVACGLVGENELGLIDE